MKAGLPFGFSWKWLAQVIGFAGLYFALARFGNVAVVAEGNASTVWPAAGLAVAGLWWGGYRLAPAIALGAFVFAWLNGVPAPVGAAVRSASCAAVLSATRSANRSEYRWLISPSSGPAQEGSLVAERRRGML